MTVSATTNRETFAGPYTVAIDFTLKIFEDSDLVLVISDDTTGEETLLVLDTNYTIAIADPGPGGTITLVDGATLMPTGTTLTVLTSLPYTQEIDLEAGGNMPAEVLEEGLDRATILIQQLKELLDRTPKLAQSSTYSELSYPDPEAGKYIVWKTDLTGFTNVAVVLNDREIALSEYGESVVAATDADILQDLLEISAFVKTLLDDADLAAVLTSLGLDTDLATLALPASTTISAFAKTLLDDAAAANARATLGVLDKVVQVVYSEVTALVSGSTVMPIDDTIPQNNEGVEVIPAVTITPTSATNILLIIANIAGMRTPNGLGGIALFQGATAGALAAVPVTELSLGHGPITLIHPMLAGGVAETTFQVRIGQAGAGTVYCNAVPAGTTRAFGGVSVSSLTIIEIVP